MSVLVSGLDQGQRALVSLLRLLDERGYDFTPVTPSTHRRVLRRDPGVGRDLRDLLGWSRPVKREEVPADIAGHLTIAEAFPCDADGLRRSTVRVSRVGGRLFAHSAFPTDAEDAVFLGPDTCRFARFIARSLEDAATPERIVDIGAGAGVGGILAGLKHPEARVELTDVNPKALWLAQVNAAHAGVQAETVVTGGLDDVAPGFDLALANPPFMANSRKTYSAGGGLHGAQLSLDWTQAALAKLAPGGRLVMYTASAITAGGEDRLAAELARLADAHQAALTYEELDPDIFGEVLGEEAYQGVERIAAVGVTLARRSD